MSDQQNDKRIKYLATRYMNVHVFENMNAPEDIWAECSDGPWVRRLWRRANGRFGWSRWERI